MQPQWKAVWRFLKNLGTKLLYDPEIPLLGIYPEGTKTEKKKKNTCISLFIAVLFSTARTWKHPRCPSTDEWIKLWYIYTMQCYSDIKRNKCELVLVSWMNLASVIQTEVNQKERNKYHINAYTGCREKRHWWTYLHGKNWDADIQDRFVDSARRRGQDRLRK